MRLTVLFGQTVDRIRLHTFADFGIRQNSHAVVGVFIQRVQVCFQIGRLFHFIQNE